MSKTIREMPLVPAAQVIQHLKTPLYRNAYALIFNSATTSVLGIAYWSLAARYYPTESVGRNSAAIAATILLSSIAALYLDGALMRFIPRRRARSGPLILAAYLITTMVAAAVSILFLLGIQYWSPALSFLNAGFETQGWFILATITGTVFFLQDGALIGLREAVWVPVENTVFSIAKLILLVIFANSFAEYGIFASWTLPAALLILPVNYLIFWRFIREHPAAEAADAPPAPFGEIVRYVAGNYIGLLFLVGYTKLLPLMVIQEAGSQAAAYFYLPWIVATSLQLVAQNMSASLVVEGSMDESSSLKNARSTMIHTFRLLVPVCVLLALFSPVVLNIYGQAYVREASRLLTLLALAVIPSAVITLFVGMSRIQKRTGRIVVVNAIVSILVLGLSHFLLPIYGITGVGIAWLTSQSAMALVLLATYLRPILTRPPRVTDSAHESANSPAD